jgi:tetratricopeptide (TPR) repeat protein
MTWIVLLASAALACVAAAGVLWPFSRSRALTLEALTDPLEDERSSLFRSLKDLDDERATGQLSEDAYRALRRETEGRAVSVLRALEARGSVGELASDLRELRPHPASNSAGNGELAGSPGRRRRQLLTVVAGAVVVAVVGVVLARAIQTRGPGESITGTTLGGLAFFEDRVARHPGDVAARLDLAQRYLETGDAQSAVRQYVAILDLDPQNAEARAQLGFLVYQAGRAADGLAAVRQALEIDPTYPEALYFEGVILLKGLNRPADAAQALRAYLDAAPFGAHRDEVEQLLKEAEGAGG